MIIVASGIAVIMLVLVIVFRNYKREVPEENELGKHPLKGLYGCCALIQDISDRYLKKKTPSDILTKFEHLYPDGRAWHRYRLWQYKRNAIIIIIIFIAAVFSVIYSIKNSTAKVIEEGVIKRPDIESEEVILEYTTEDFGGDIEYELNSERMTYAEFYAFFKESEDTLIKVMLADNVSADEVKSDLYFPDYLPDTKIELLWETSDISVIMNDGTVVNEELEESMVVTIFITANYYGDICLLNFPVLVLPKEYSEQELFEMELIDRIKKLDDTYKYDSEFKLPDETGGKGVFWSAGQDKMAFVITVAGIILATVSGYGFYDDIRKQEKKREKEMLMDYSEVVSELTLFLEAGLTIRGAFERIAENYNKRKTTAKKSRYSYEEISRCVREIESGISEAEAYRTFGRRCALIPYIRLATIISQNLKRGTKGVVLMLREEAYQAFEIRKAGAKKLGEEAGTKMLAPMMAYLVIVIVIIVVPAVMSF